MIFVFGSNEAGIHGGGAARTAHLRYGAEMYVGIGPTGNCYAIPTKDKRIETLPIIKIKGYVDDFIEYAKANSHQLFNVTRIGCGLAGLKDDDIAPLFSDAPDNCILPPKWSEMLGKPTCLKQVGEVFHHPTPDIMDHADFNQYVLHEVDGGWSMFTVV